ncbi:MAG: tetratricopeptide repeat protein [Sterolibacterium sp.]|nr:tetratricopeptide repeat protein [Sterolibacterium sp.]MBP9798876.1 tetratricopeptide repeat protein [Sterolibacterium sp.]
MKKPGRNDACPCGSGKKAKHCCRQSAIAGTGTAVPLGQPSQSAEEARLLQQAMQHQAAQDWPQAIACLESILQGNPQHAEALHQMGVVAHRLGDHKAALELVALAIRANPASALYHSNLGNMQYQAGQLTEAEHSFRQAVALNPGFAQAQYDLAVVLQERGQGDAAVASYRVVLHQNPQHVDAWRNLGRLLEEQGNLDEAMDCYQRAVEIRPKYAEAHFQLGAGFDRQGENDKAVMAYQQAIRHRPDFAEAYNNLGVAYLNLVAWDEAEICFNQAIQLQPDLYESYVGLGRVAFLSGRDDEGMKLLRKALSIKPDSGYAHSGILFQMQRSPRYSMEDQWAECRYYANIVEAPLRQYWRQHERLREPQRRLRLGYVSGDFYYHPVASYIEPILMHHDKTQVEVFCYYNFDKHDDMTERLKAHADHWIPCSFMTDEALAERIRADQIDILVDLSGHTAYNRLMTFARKPAPVQATWMGFAGTTGLTAMDYRITDAYLDPPGMTERFHSEQLIRLPGSNIPFHPESWTIEVGELPALRSGRLVLASLNTPNKLNQNVLNVWGRILTALPHAQLMLGNVINDTARASLLGMCQRAGIPEDRLILQPRMSIQGYLATHQQIDLGLDPFPYPGSTSTLNSLWMGVPVITLVGMGSAARAGAAIMGYVGLDSFVTASEDAYVQRALEVVADLPALNQIRQSLRPRMQQTVCNAAGITRNLEAAYRDMWLRWLATS